MIHLTTRPRGFLPPGSLEALTQVHRGAVALGSLYCGEPPPTLVPDDLAENLNCQVATTESELACAYAMVHDAYVQKGLMDPHPSGMRVSLFNALPHAITFTATHRESPVATVTLVIDSPLGLPMDEVYKREVDGLRTEERKVAEISALAAQGSFANRSVLVHLLRPVFLLARAAGVDDLCIAVHPRYAPFYGARFLFKTLGAPKCYASVRNALAAALRLDLRALEKRPRGVPAKALIWSLFERPGLSPAEEMRSVLPRPILPAQMLRRFFVVETDVLRRAPRAALEFLKACYPLYDFRRILAEA